MMDTQCMESIWSSSDYEIFQVYIDQVDILCVQPCILAMQSVYLPSGGYLLQLAGFRRPGLSLPHLPLTHHCRQTHCHRLPLCHARLLPPDIQRENIANNMARNTPGFLGRSGNQRWNMIKDWLEIDELHISLSMKDTIHY